MKTLILQNILSSNNVFAINTLIAEKHIDRHNVQVLFCAETESNRQWTLHETPTFQYQVLPKVEVKLQGQDLFTYFLNFSIIKKLNAENPDWIIVGGWDQFAYQAAVFWGKLHGKRVTIWSGSTINESSWRRTLTFPLVKFLIWCASDFLAYGIRAKEYLIVLGAPPNKIQIFLNDVNRTYFEKQAKKLRPKKKLLKQKLQITAKYNFIFVGQLIERKGVLDLLSAYHQLSKEHFDWGLVIVGYGYLSDQIREYCERHNLVQVKMVGSIEQYQLSSYYVVSDCLILPSHEEVWGLVANEAIASGIPVILSNKCGCGPDLKKIGNVTIFQINDATALYRSMIKFVQNFQPL